MTSSLGPALESYLAAQEAYELRRTAWVRGAGRGLCDLSYANPQDGPNEEVIRAMADALHEARPLDLQYTPYGGSTVTRRLVAHRLAETHREAFRWQDVVMTPGAMAALNVVFRWLRSDGARDEVIVPVPCWHDYPLYLEHLGLRPVLVPLEPTTFHLDLDRIARALNPSTRAIVISQPANPTGVMYSAEELGALGGELQSAAARFGTTPWIVSDECHRDVVFDGRAFVSPLSCYDRTVIVYSFGKSLYIQGQRIGYVAVSPRAPDRDAVAETYARLCRTMGFCTPTSLMQLAVRRLLRVTPDCERLAARRQRVTAALGALGYDVPPSDATFFLYPRSPDPDDQRFVDALGRNGVLVLPAALFHHQGHFRISVTASDATIDRALVAFERLMAGSHAP